MNKWYYSEKDQQQGPVSSDVIQSKIASGALPPTTLVWKQGMDDWVEANQVSELKDVVATAPSPVSVQNPVSSSVPTPYAAPNSTVASSSAAGPMPNTYLWQAIVCTLCCCIPFGIVSIVYAAQVSSKYVGGDYYGAEKASQNAKKWMMAAVIGGLVAILLQFLMGGFSVFAN